jgi:hypothetical protein
VIGAISQTISAVVQVVCRRWLSGTEAPGSKRGKSSVGSMVNSATQGQVSSFPYESFLHNRNNNNNDNNNNDNNDNNNNNNNVTQSL